MLFLGLLLVIAHGFVELNQQQQQRQLQNLILQEKLQQEFQANEPEPLRNIDYILNGYNLLTGSPASWTQTSDPGFSGRNIFQAKYEKKQMTADGRHKIPDGANVIMRKGCKYNFQSQTLRNRESVQNYLASFAGLSMISNFELTPWAFTSSTEFNFLQKQMQEKESVFVISQAQCQVQQVTLNPELPEFSQSFLEAIKQLPAEYDASRYIDFLQNFGTHYIVELIFGSRTGYVFSIDKKSVLQVGEKSDEKYNDEELEQAASVTSALLKGVLSQQSNNLNILVLPKAQTGKEFKDLSLNSAYSFVITIGAQTDDPDVKAWLKESEAEPIPIKYSLRSLADLIAEGKGKLSDIKENAKIAKNIKQAYTDYCELLTLQGKRQGQCLANKRELSQWFPQKTVCLNFFQSCDWQGENTQVCGNKNPIQEIGNDLPEIQANSVRFHHDRNIIVSNLKYFIDPDQLLVLDVFMNYYLVLDKAEICLLNQGQTLNTVYPVYITDSTKCVILLLWNACSGEVVYFTAAICSSLDLESSMKDVLNKDQKCEVAILDIRYPNQIQLRICLYKEIKMEGASSCFNNDQKEQYFGQTFKSMIIEENEIMVHRQMPGSISVIFE